VVKTAWPERTLHRRVVYGGTEGQERSYARRVLPWTAVDRCAAP
jgi:hypothetical protein